MAYPQFATKGTMNAVTTATVAPSCPATVNANDILVCLVIAANIGSGKTITGPSGWTELTQGQFQNSAGTLFGQAGIWWKRAAGTEDGSTLSITHNGTTGTTTCFMAQVWPITGCYTTGNWYDDFEVNYAINGTSPATTPLVSTAALDATRTQFVFVLQADNVDGGGMTGLTAQGSDATTTGSDADIVALRAYGVTTPLEYSSSTSIQTEGCVVVNIMARNTSSVITPTSKVLGHPGIGALDAITSGSISYPANAYVRFTKVVSSAAPVGSINRIQAKFVNTTGTNGLWVKPGIYTDSGGAPGSLILDGPLYEVPAGAALAWHSVPLRETWYPAASTTYWIAIAAYQVGGGGGQYGETTGGSNVAAYQSSDWTWPEFPSPASSVAQSTAKYSMYGAGDTGVAYNIFNKVTADVLTPTYHMRALAAKTLTPTYDILAGLAAVSQTLTPLYDMRQLATDTLAPSYDLRQLATKTLQPSYDSRQLGTKTLVPSYAMRQLGTKTLSPSYSLLQLAADTLTPTYSLLNLVADTLSPTYTLQQLATKTLAATYDLLTLSGVKTLSPSFDVRQLATKTLSPEYNILVIGLTPVTQTLSPSYALMQLATKTIAPAYRIWQNPSGNGISVSIPHIEADGWFWRDATYPMTVTVDQPVPAGSQVAIWLAHDTAGWYVGHVMTATVDGQTEFVGTWPGGNHATPYGYSDDWYFPMAYRQDTNASWGSWSSSLPDKYAMNELHMNPDYPPNSIIHRGLDSVPFTVRFGKAGEGVTAFVAQQQDPWTWWGVGAESGYGGSLELADGVTSYSLDIDTSLPSLTSPTQTSQFFLYVRPDIDVWGNWGDYDMTAGNAVFDYVSQTTSPTYGIFNLATKALTPVYDLRQLGTKTLSPSYWLLNTAPAKTLSPVYDLRTRASDTLTATYNLRQLASDTLAPSYNVRQLATDILTPTYSMRQLATKVLTPAYAMRQLATDTIVPVYDVRGLALKSLTPIYDILMLVAMFPGNPRLHDATTMNLDLRQTLIHGSAATLNTRAPDTAQERVARMEEA